jgi:hypothetical protein
MSDSVSKQNQLARIQRMGDLLERYDELCEDVNVPLSFQIPGSEETLMRTVSVGVREFQKLVYSDKWILTDFDWGSWSEGREIAGDPERIGQCDMEPSAN